MLTNRRVYWTIVHQIRVPPTMRRKYETSYSDYSWKEI